MKTLAVLAAALVLTGAAPAMAMGCCGGKGKAGMCAKGGATAMNAKGRKGGGCCCEGMGGGTMSRRT